MPITYLLIILLLVPSAESVINEVSVKEFSTYTKALTNEDKLAIILDKYDLTKKEFNVLKAICLSEAESNSYTDAYAVINTIYNRTHSKSWVKSISNRYGKDTGKSMYYQAIAPNQFVVYQHGSYKKHLKTSNGLGYDAIIDFLYSEEIMHNYLSFRAHNIKVKNSVAFSDKGNNYFNELKLSNRI